MSPNVNFSKLKKCGQVWDEMSPCEGGRQCTACQETIIDFRGMTDWKVAQIHATSGGKVCGIYDEKMLNPDLRNNKSPKQNRKLFLAGVFSFLATSTGFSQAKSTQNNTELLIPSEQNKKSNKANNEKENNKKTTQTDSLKIVRGVLKEENLEPIIGGVVLVDGTENGVVTDVEGTFAIDITEEITESDSVVLLVSYIGYHNSKITVFKSDFVTQKEVYSEIILDNNGIKMESFGVVRNPLHKRIWFKILRIFR